VALRAIALDLDGTLVKTGVLEISDADRQAIHDAASAGVHVVVATARTPSQARQFQRELGLVGPVIGNNGSLVELEDGRELLHRRIEAACAHRILTALVEADLHPSIIQGNAIFRRSGPDRRAGRESFTVNFCEYAVETVDDPFAVIRDGATQIGIFARSLEPVLQRLASEPVCALRYYDAEVLSGAIFVHVDASKGDALRAVFRYLDVDPVDTLAVGDSEADLPMFSVVGHAVAVGNANPAVRAAARAAGQTVLHAHVHLIPRYAGDVEDPRGGVRWIIPSKGALLEVVLLVSSPAVSGWNEQAEEAIGVEPVAVPEVGERLPLRVKARRALAALELLALVERTVSERDRVDQADLMTGATVVDEEVLEGSEVAGLVDLDADLLCQLAANRLGTPLAEVDASSERPERRSAP